jgi:carbonic anhydrase/acetyltransferase-like protein (isoleucine patch superfamily)
MIKSFEGKSPKIAPSALIHDSCLILGDVEIGENSSVWPGAVIRGDVARIKIGDNVHIQDNSVVHTEFGSELGNNIVIGHSVVVHVSKLGSNCMVGNNATLLDNSEIGDWCMIAAGSVIPPETKFPDKSLIMGTPAKRKSDISEKHLEQIQYSVEWYAKMVQRYKNSGY